MNLPWPQFGAITGLTGMPWSISQPLPPPMFSRLLTCADTTLLVDEVTMTPALNWMFLLLLADLVHPRDHENTTLAFLLRKQWYAASSLLLLLIVN